MLQGQQSISKWFQFDELLVHSDSREQMSICPSVLMLKPGEGAWQNMRKRDKALAAREVHSKGFTIPRGYHDDKVNYLDGNISRDIVCSG